MAIRMTFPEAAASPTGAAVVRVRYGLHRRDGRTVPVLTYRAATAVELTPAVWDELGARIGASRPTMLRWYRLVQGRPRDEWPGLLSPRYVGRQPDPIDGEAWNCFLAAYRVTHPSSIKEAFRVVEAEARRCGWSIPGEATFRRHLNRSGERRPRSYLERYLNHDI